MQKFVFVYQHPAGYVPGKDPIMMATWQKYFEKLGSSMVDPGQPVFERVALARGSMGPG